MSKKLCPALVVVLFYPSLMSAQAQDKGAVAINTKFPGGNLHIESNDGDTVHAAPDLRGDNPWFYWYFEAKATKPGRVNFVFPRKVLGFKNGAIGYQGPAVSFDRGRTWKWMGTKTVRENAFYYDFKKNETVRFAVTIPYVLSDLEKFLQRHAKNKHLKSSVLTKSRKGRPLPLLRIGSPGEGKLPVLVTARHHAVETIASFLLEGFLQEAMSDSAAGRAFRKNYLLYAVPMVDLDGVEDGDQGKFRKPRDYNRDYGEKSIYPEIQAIKALDRKINFRLTLDWHCPTLKMPDHQVFYFVGAKNHPKYNFVNVSEFARRIKAGLPKNAPYGPLVWLRDASKPKPMNSHYFAFKKGAIMAATLETPFAPKGKATDAASCRRYGQVILRAWVNTRFVAAESK